MSNPRFIRIGLARRAASVRLRLRWDRSPQTCAAVLPLCPAEGPVWHAKYANNEIYMLTAAQAEPPPAEWATVYPGFGDLLYIPILPGALLPPGAPPMDWRRGILDIAYFYERGNNLNTAPSGPVSGTIFATIDDVDETEAFARACADVWYRGAADERMSLALEG